MDKSKDISFIDESIEKAQAVKKEFNENFNSVFYSFSISLILLFFILSTTLNPHILAFHLFDLTANSTTTSILSEFITSFSELANNFFDATFLSDHSITVLAAISTFFLLPGLPVLFAIYKLAFVWVIAVGLYCFVRIPIFLFLIVRWLTFQFLGSTKVSRARQEISYHFNKWEQEVSTRNEKNFQIFLKDSSPSELTSFVLLASIPLVIPAVILNSDMTEAAIDFVAGIIYASYMILLLFTFAFVYESMNKKKWDFFKFKYLDEYIICEVVECLDAINKDEQEWRLPKYRRKIKARIDNRVHPSYAMSNNAYR